MLNSITTCRASRKSGNAPTVTKQSHQFINQDSGQVERYTPRDIIAAEIKIMGHIDLDPACNDNAYQFHGGKLVPMTGLYIGGHSTHYYALNGLELPYFGNVHLNPPFGRDMLKWITKLINAYNDGEVTQACIMTFNSSETQWGQMLVRYPQFIFAGRVNYENGIVKPSEAELEQLALLEGVQSVADSGATKGSVLTFLPPRGMRYETACSRLTDELWSVGRRGWAK